MTLVPIKILRRRMEYFTIGCPSLGEFKFPDFLFEPDKVEEFITEERVRMGYGWRSVVYRTSFALQRYECIRVVKTKITLLVKHSL